MKNTPTKNFRRKKTQLTMKEKDTHTSSLNYLLPREPGLPACLDNRLEHQAQALLQSGW